MNPWTVEGVFNILNTTKTTRKKNGNQSYASTNTLQLMSFDSSADTFKKCRPCVKSSKHVTTLHVSVRFTIRRSLFLFRKVLATPDKLSSLLTDSSLRRAWRALDLSWGLWCPACARETRCRGFEIRSQERRVNSLVSSYRSFPPTTVARHNVDPCECRYKSVPNERSNPFVFRCRKSRVLENMFSIKCMQKFKYQLPLPSVSLAAIHSFDLGTPWQLAQTLLWNGMALLFLSNSCSSVLSRGTATELSTSNIDNGNTLKRSG